MSLISSLKSQVSCQILPKYNHLIILSNKLLSKNVFYCNSYFIFGFKFRNPLFISFMRIQYNSPVILTFAIICTVLRFIEELTGSGMMMNWFALMPDRVMHGSNYYPTLVTYALGHASLDHLLGNMSLLLLTGPAVEERIGGRQTFWLIIATALLSGIIQVFAFKEGLIGASGVVFMFIVLSSFANARSGVIPLTFILVVLLFVGKEILSSMKEDEVSQFAHIAGGVIGSIYGIGRQYKTV
jgi:membrane associated rhomboid family serine protease